MTIILGPTPLPSRSYAWGSLQWEAGRMLVMVLLLSYVQQCTQQPV
jgi:hypothetical protein